MKIITRYACLHINKWIEYQKISTSLHCMHNHINNMETFLTVDEFISYCPTTRFYSLTKGLVEKCGEENNKMVKLKQHSDLTDLKLNNNQVRWSDLNYSLEHQREALIKRVSGWFIYFLCHTLAPHSPELKPSRRHRQHLFGPETSAHATDRRSLLGVPDLVMQTLPLPDWRFLALIVFVYSDFLHVSVTIRWCCIFGVTNRKTTLEFC